MKKFIVLVLTAVWILLLLCGCNNAEKNTDDFIRIHIRANANDFISQNVKYTVKDNVMNFLLPFVAECDSKQKALDMIEENIDSIQYICDSTLAECGHGYKSKALLVYEYFPLRDYNGFTAEAGYYHSLIIELGEAKGDNWWCMIYPPLCFSGEYNGGGNIKYKSKIAEIIEKICK